MHKDNKTRREELRRWLMRDMRKEKEVDPKALKKFRASPYQMQYAERLKHVNSTCPNSDSGV